MMYKKLLTQVDSHKWNLSVSGGDESCNIGHGYSISDRISGQIATFRNPWQ